MSCRSEGRRTAFRSDASGRQSGGAGDRICGIGKISFPDGVVAALVTGGFEELPISAAHAEQAPQLPSHHRDPFDRMLVVQAKAESLALVTADRRLLPYDVELVDARL